MHWFGEVDKPDGGQQQRLRGSPSSAGGVLPTEGPEVQPLKSPRTDPGSVTRLRVCCAIDAATDAITKLAD